MIPPHRCNCVATLPGEMQLFQSWKLTFSYKRPADAKAPFVSTQLDVQLSSVDLCRYKWGLTHKIVYAACNSLFWKEWSLVGDCHGDGRGTASQTMCHVIASISMAAAANRAAWSALGFIAGFVTSHCALTKLVSIIVGLYAVVTYSQGYQSVNQSINQSINPQ